MNVTSYVPAPIKRLVPSFIKRRVRSMLGASPSRPTSAKTWGVRPDDLPWFDRTNALELLAQRRPAEGLSEDEYLHLQRWVTEGYFVLSGAVDHQLIDTMTLDLNGLWTAQTPHPGLSIDGLRLQPNAPPVTLSHRELLDLALPDRLAARDRSNWRVHGFHSCSASAKALFELPELRRQASLVLTRSARPGYAINFMYGSTQTEHQDTAVFHVFPPNYIVAAWIACEDISPDSGPLMFYPRSHREPIFHGFDNYPQTSLKTASAELTREYYEYVAALARKFDRHLLLAKKGDVFFWHGMLLHGGSEIKNHALTRRSFVIHYIPPAMDVTDQIVGPFNW
jgi:phytanoyl-CoA hydroxylase